MRLSEQMPFLTACTSPDNNYRLLKPHFVASRLVCHIIELLPAGLSGLAFTPLYLTVICNDESRIIFLLKWPSICQYRPKISAITVKKQSRARLTLAHPVLYILKTQKNVLCILKTTISKSTKKRYGLRTAKWTISESGSVNATWVV